MSDPGLPPPPGPPPGDPSQPQPERGDPAFPAPPAAGDPFPPAPGDSGLPPDPGAAAAPAAAPPTGDEEEEARKAREKKNIQQIGQSVYVRKKIKVDDRDGHPKTKTFWILEGKTVGDTDREFMWEERRAKDGSTQYKNVATGRSSRQLPDVGPTASTAAAAADLAQQLSPRRQKQQHLEGWTQEQKIAVQAYARKQFSRHVKDGKIEPLTPEVQKILVKNVADNYMSEHPPFEDVTLPKTAEQTLTEDVKRQLGDWLDERNEQLERAQAEAEMPDLSYLDHAALDEEAALPDKPDKGAPAPHSKFLPRANYLRDPYYYMRVDCPNPRRSVLEEELETKLFFTPNMGEVKVLGAVQGWNCHPTDPKQSEPCIIAVVRDWVGGCCLMYIQPPSPEYSIISTYPITDHVEKEFRSLAKHYAPKGDMLRTYLSLDDQWHTIGVRSVDDQRYIETCLRLAMCMMYGKGNDDDRIMRMRTHSVEFAWNHTASIPQEAAMAKFDRLMTASDEELERYGGDAAKYVDSLVHDLRMYMLAADQRDLLLRRWVNHVTKRREPPPRSELLRRQLRLVEEAIRYPAPSNDPFLADHVQKALATVELDLARNRESRDESLADAGTWKDSPGRLADLWKLLCGTSADYVSRDALPDKAIEKCFNPAPGSEAAEVQKKNLQIRHINFREHQLPSGIYLSVLVYTGDTEATREVLTDSHNNLPTELIETQLTDKQIQTLTRDSVDFRWIAEQGVDPNWAESIQVWSQLYDNSGTGRFRSFFLEATRKMQKLLGRYDLGVVFDDVVLLKEVRTMHILTVLKLKQKEEIPFLSPAQQDWLWQPAIDAEYQSYLKSFLIRASTRVSFLPSTYNDCRRWIHAAAQHRESTELTIQPGLYVGFFGCLPSTSGFKVQVVSTHRHLIPLARVQEEHPTLEQWRWVQCLNEKKRRAGSYEWHTVSDKVKPSDLEHRLPTFRHKFLRAVLELEQTTGRKVEHIHDLEVISFDEAREIKVIAVVERFLSEPPQYTPPRGTAPCVWKNWELAEAQYMALYWPRAWAMFSSARQAADAAQRRVMQPFAADEALRMEQTGAMQHVMEVERLFLPLRWWWSLWNWAGKGYPSVVEAYEGEVDRTVVRGIEESVEVAVSNYATQQDINHLTLKSLTMDAHREPDWETLLAKLREIERTMKYGYAQRVHVADALKTDPVPQERTWDELYSDEGSDDYEDVRPPTVYELDCTIEEFVERDGADPSAYFMAQAIVREVVERSMIQSIDVGVVKECGECISSMVSVLEVTDALCNDASILALKEGATDVVMAERDRYQRSWLDVFHEDDEAAFPKGDDHDLSDEEDDDDAEDFTQGSSRIVQTPEQGLRVCMARAMDAAHQIEGLLRLINSAQEALELTDAVADYEGAVSQQVAIIRTSVESAKVAPGSKSPSRGRRIAGGSAPPAPTVTTSVAALSPDVPQPPFPAGSADLEESSIQRQPTVALPSPSPFAGMASPGEASQPPKPGAAALTMVSRDYREYRVEAADSSRCLALKAAKGKIRFPEVHSSLLSVVAYFLSLPDSEISSFLLGLEETLHQAGVQPQALLALATQLKSPLLTLRAAALLYGTPVPTTAEGHDRSISGDAASQLKVALESSFLMSFGVKDWLQWEALGGGAVIPVLDVLWWVRYVKEAAPASGEQPPAFPDYEQAWKQMYAETRVRVFLSRGTQQLQREEVALWSGSFGELVQYLSFRDRAIGDDEVEVLTACCPNLRSLDLSGTQVTDRTVDILQRGCPNLSDVNADGSRMTPRGRKQLADYASANASRALPVS
eukprot:Hpha_TRINITY_DN1780_c0_g2::TRINITY_DN1780_c0_g2_i1::g.158428::m.158428